MTKKIETEDVGSVIWLVQYLVGQKYVTSSPMATQALPAPAGGWGGMGVVGSTLLGVDYPHLW